MSVQNGYSPEDGSAQPVIVCEHVPYAQLGLVGKVLERALQLMPGPDSGNDQSDAEWAAVFNMLCDLEVPGYEM